MSEIDTYQAGRKLDALVAKEVFGIEAKHNPGHYSTDEAAAMQLVKHLCQDDRDPRLYFKLTYGFWAKKDSTLLAMAIFAFGWKTGNSRPLYQGLADTIPLAICRAALRAVREDLSLPEVSR